MNRTLTTTLIVLLATGSQVASAATQRAADQTTAEPQSWPLKIEQRLATKLQQDLDSAQQPVTAEPLPVNNIPTSGVVARQPEPVSGIEKLMRRLQNLWDFLLNQDD